MRALNQKGQVVLFFVLTFPILVLFFVSTVKFSKLVFTTLEILDRNHH